MAHGVCEGLGCEISIEHVKLFRYRWISSAIASGPISHPPTQSASSSRIKYIDVGGQIEEP